MLTLLPPPDTHRTLHNLALLVEDMAVELARLRKIVEDEPETRIIDVEPNGNGVDVDVLMIDPQLETARERGTTDDTSATE